MENKNDVVGDHLTKNHAVVQKYGLIHGTGSYDSRSVLNDDEVENNVPDANGSTDDFRPTAPGHSPGAGHSHGPSRVDPNRK